MAEDAATRTKRATTFLALCGITTLVRIELSPVNDLSRAGIPLTLNKLRDAIRREVWEDDGSGSETGWDDHTTNPIAGSGGGATTRTVEIDPAAYEAELPLPIYALVNAGKINTAVWVLETFAADEILAMHVLMGDDFVRQMHTQRPRNNPLLR